ncbi:MAG: NAD-dependent epimerase/dehydratase family protein [Candidatus Kapabacteria bacterium]|nr:NAD-dependent epimerase/dehydratase family protein [Candidatus Kapabacteria bacterium]
MSRTVLVIGGAGFIGSHTADRLLQLGYHVRVLDNLQKPVHTKGKPGYLDPAIEFIEADARDPQAMLGALRGVDAVYHLAAYQDYLSDFSTFFHVNAVSTALLYELIVAHHLPIEKVVVASSQFVQGEGRYRRADGSIVAPTLRTIDQLQRGQWDWVDPDGQPLQWEWTAEDHVNPPNAYAMSKHSQEQQAIRFGLRYGIPSTALRYSIVQGARQSVYNAYSGACRIFCLHYLLGRAPTLYEDGQQCRDFINIHDVVDANILALQDPRTDYEVLNVGGGKAYTVAEFDRIVAQAFGREELEPNIPGEFRFGDTRNACSDTTKLRSLGWEPKRTAQDSVREYVEYLQRQSDLQQILDHAEKTMKGMNVVQAVKK